MIWELGEDNADAELLRAAHQGLHPDAVPPPVTSTR
jgi:hypothetical protein